MIIYINLLIKFPLQGLPASGGDLGGYDLLLNLFQRFTFRFR